MPLAWSRVDAWLSCDTVWTPGPSDRHAEVVGKLMGLPGVYANLVPDGASRRAGDRAWVDIVLD